MGPVWRVRNADRSLAGLIEQHLKGGTERCVVLENPMALRSDPYLAGLKSKLAFHESHVFHVLEPGASTEQVLAALKESRSWWGWVGVLTRAERRLGSELEATQFDELAEQAVAFFVGAYDGEGFVYLRRDAISR